MVCSAPISNGTGVWRSEASRHARGGCDTGPAGRGAGIASAGAEAGGARAAAALAQRRTSVSSRNCTHAPRLNSAPRNFNRPQRRGQLYKSDRTRADVAALWSRDHVLGWGEKASSDSPPSRTNPQSGGEGPQGGTTIAHQRCLLPPASKARSAQRQRPVPKAGSLREQGWTRFRAQSARSERGGLRDAGRKRRRN